MLLTVPDAVRFIDEAFKHGKAIMATCAGVDLVAATKTGELTKKATAEKQGVLLGESNADLAAKFIEAIAHHRFHNRQVDKIMA